MNIHHNDEQRWNTQKHTPYRDIRFVLPLPQDLPFPGLSAVVPRNKLAIMTFSISFLFRSLTIVPEPLGLLMSPQTQEYPVLLLVGDEFTLENTIPKII